MRIGVSEALFLQHTPRKHTKPLLLIKRHVSEHPNTSNTHTGGIRGVMKGKERRVKEQLLIAAVM